MADPIGATDALARMQILDIRLSLAAVESVTGPRLLSVFLAVSRFADWSLSLATGASIGVLAGPGSLARHALRTGLALLVQKRLKRAFARARPCLTEGGPAQRAPIPNAGSFPSGHTLHALLAAGAIAAVFTPLVFVYGPLALAMGASRVVLGVHYPSDVAVGAVLGAFLAATFVLIWEPDA